MRGPSVQGARRSARGGVLEQYVEHGEQAQRSNGGPIPAYRVLRPSGGEKCGLGLGRVVGKKLPDALRLCSIDDRRQLFEAGAAHLFEASEVSQ